MGGTRSEEVELFDGQVVTIEPFDFRQMKNRNRHGGCETFIPVVDKLASALAPLDRSKGGTVLRTSYGEPFSPKSLDRQDAHWTKQAGIEAGYTLPGLRATFGTYLTGCNLSARMIIEAMGHTSMAVTDKYVAKSIGGR